MGVCVCVRGFFFGGVFKRENNDVIEDVITLILRAVGDRKDRWNCTKDL